MLTIPLLVGAYHILKSSNAVSIPTVQHRMKDRIEMPGHSFFQKLFPPEGYGSRVIAEYAAAVGAQHKMLCALLRKDCRRKLHPVSHDLAGFRMASTVEIFSTRVNPGFIPCLAQAFGKEPRFPEIT